MAFGTDDMNSSQAQYVKADTHYYLRMAPYCLFRMKVFVQIMKNRRHNDSKATEFRRWGQVVNLLAVKMLDSELKGW